MHLILFLVDTENNGSECHPDHVSFDPLVQGQTLEILLLLAITS